MPGGWNSGYAGSTAPTSTSTPSTGGGWNSGYAGSGTAAPAPKGGGGFGSLLHSVGHFIADQASKGGRLVESIPGGMKQMGQFAADPWVIGYDKLVGDEKGAQAHYQDASNFGKGYEQTLLHPTSNPGGIAGWLTAAAPILHVGGIGVAKVGGVDLAEPRIIRTGDTENGVQLHGSHNAGLRLIQKGYDAVLQKAIDRQNTLAEQAKQSGRLTDTIAAHAARRAAGAALSASRITTRMREAAPFLLGRAAKGFSKLTNLAGNGFKAEDVADQALALVLENALPREAAMAHRTWAEEGLSPEENQTWAKLYEHMDQLGLVKLDHETGHAEIDPNVSPELAQVSELLKDTSTEADTAIERSGLMSAEDLKARRDAVNQVRAGMHIPAPMSRALRDAIAQRDRLVAKHEAALDADEAFRQGKGPRTVDGYRVPQGPNLTQGGVEVPGLTPKESPLRDRIVRLGLAREAAESRVQKLAEQAARQSQHPEPYQRTVLREIATELHGGDRVAAENELRLLDSVANKWAIENNSTVPEFYRQYISEVRRGLPEEGTNALYEVTPHWRDIQRAINSVDTGVFRQLGVRPSEFARYISEGEPGRFWYEESGKAILDMVHGDRQLADKIAQLVAIYSPQREPIPNMQLAVNAYNEFLQKGRVESYGTSPQIQKANDILVDGKEWAGLKTDRFYANLLEEIDPEKYAREFPGGEVTNDLWMARLFGLKSEDPTPREYEAMTGIVRHIADQLGWKPKQVQAAIWVAKKAEAGGMGAAAGKGMPMEDAKVNFGTALEREHAIVPFEAAPGRETAPELAASYEQLTPELKKAYTDAKAQAVSDYLNDAGIFGQLGNEGPGVYEGHINPGWSVYIAASRGKGAAFALRVSPESAVVLDHAASAIGEALNQDAAAWFKPFVRKNITSGKWNAIRLDLGRTISEDEAAALDNELRATGNDIAVVHDKNGVRLLNFSALTNKDFQALVRRVAEANLPTLRNAEGFAFDGNYIERADYADRLGQLAAGTGGRSDVLRAAFLRLQERSAAIDRQFFAPEEEAAGERGVGAAGGRLGGRGEPGGSLRRLNQEEGGVVRGAYEPSTGRLFVGPHAQPGTILHEGLHATLESLPPILKRALLEHYGSSEITPDLHEQFVRDMTQRAQTGQPPALEAVYDLMQHQPREGVGYVPGHTSEESGGTSLGPARARGPVVGEGRKPLNTKQYRGVNLMHGARGLRTVNMVAAHIRRLNKWLETTDLRQSAVQNSGHTLRRSDRDILVRDLSENIPRARRGSSPRISADVEALLGRRVPLHTVPIEEAAETKAGLVAGFQSFLDEMFPGASDKGAYKDVQSGTPAPAGYKWVDRGALGNLSRFQPRGEASLVGRVVDNTNAAVTAATVYFKLGHIYTRVMTNAVTNLMQGSITPLGLKRSVELWRQLSPEDRWRAYGSVGTNYYESLPAEGESSIAKGARFGARLFGHYVDVPFRFNSLAYELRKVGVETPEQFTHALDVVEGRTTGSAGERGKYLEAMERADREAIAYDRMNEFEKNWIARAVWFYPWVKGSTMFTFRTLFEHPFKSAVLGQAGIAGIRQQEQDFPGGVPSYEYGLIKLMNGQNPLVTDPSTFSPFATAGQLMQTPEHPMQLAGNLNPALGGLETVITQRTSTGQATKSPLIDSLLQVIAATPEAQIGQQLSGDHGKLFPAHPAFPVDFPGGAAVMRMLFGPAMPRHVNPYQLAKDAQNERTGPR